MTAEEHSSDEYPLRERLIDALELCFNQRGMQKTTLGHVAREAGVSRMTVYRHFEDKQALFAAAALRNIRRQWKDITASMEATERLDDWLMQAMLLFHSMSSQDEAVALYSRIDGHEMGLEVALSKPGLEAITSHFAELFDKAARENILAPGITTEDIAEWIHRTNYSLVAIPSERLQQKDKLRRWLSMQINGIVAR